MMVQLREEDEEKKILLSVAPRKEGPGLQTWAQ